MADNKAGEKEYLVDRMNYETVEFIKRNADEHGFLVIPQEDEKNLLEASIFMDNNECNTLIEVAKTSFGKSSEKILDSINNAGERSSKASNDKYGNKGEW